MDNTVTVAGNITADPSLSFTPTGQATVTFSVAVNRSWTDRTTNERKEAVSYIDVTAWASLAENVAETLNRGDRVVVTGRLEQRSWENQAGEKRSKVEIVADDIGPSLRWATAQVSKTERHTPVAVPAG